MKDKVIVCTLLVAGLVVAGAQPAFADYASIQHNLFDGTYDSSYVGGTLLVSGDSDLLALNDPTTLAGAVTNAHVELETYFSHIRMDGAVVKAVFRNGSYNLTFDYDDGGGPQAYALGGPISGMEFEYTELTPTLGRLDGEGLFTAGLKNLPGSGIWPDGGGASSLDTLTLTFDTQTDWTWDNDFTQGETTYSVVPNDSAVPEPAGAALVLLGAVGLLHRRRRR